MKVNEIQEKLAKIIQYGGLIGLDYTYTEPIRSVSILIDEIIDMKDDIKVLTECSCPHPMCNCCDDHACYILGDTVIGMIDEAFKESDIEL